MAFQNRGKILSLYISSHSITFCLVLVTKILLILFCCRTVYNLGIDILSIFFRVKFCYWWWIVAPIYVLVLGYVCQTLWMVNVGVEAKCCDTLVSEILFTVIWIYRLLYATCFRRRWQNRAIGFCKPTNLLR